MTTDRYIPERWRKLYGDATQPYYSVQRIYAYHVERLKLLAIIEELGTAESLIRELAPYAKHDCDLREYPDQNWPCTCGFAEVLSRIPAHLRAPETTSTGESSTVLRQEGKL